MKVSCGNRTASLPRKEIDLLTLALSPPCCLRQDTPAGVYQEESLGGLLSLFCIIVVGAPGSPQEPSGTLTDTHYPSPTECGLRSF